MWRKIVEKGNGAAVDRVVGVAVSEEQEDTCSEPFREWVRNGASPEEVFYACGVRWKIQRLVLSSQVL